MTAERRQIQHHLNALRDELQSEGLWQGTAPSPRAMASTQPFCVDTLALEQWLQFVFIPRMDALLDGDLALPAQCSVAPYAEEQLNRDAAGEADILRRIQQLDELITEAR